MIKWQSLRPFNEQRLQVMRSFLPFIKGGLLHRSQRASLLFLADT